MRSQRLALFLLVVCCQLLASAAAAQQMGVRDPMQELERTDRILDRARDQVGASPSARAGALLDHAVDMQVDARHMYNPHDRGTWRAAMRLTQQARELARRSIETAEIEIKAHESIRDLIESTRDLAMDAGTIVRERGDAEAGKLLDGGLWQLQRAQEAYRGLAYRKAIRLAATARDLVQRALQRARSGESGEGGSIEAAIDRTQALLEELGVNLEGSDDPRAVHLRDQAMRLQERALRMQREQRPTLALQLTTQARQAALEALLLLSSRPDGEEVERALMIVEQLIQDATPVILASGSSAAADMLESARQRHAEAREQLARGDASQALATARIAEGLLHRAVEVAADR